MVRRLCGLRRGSGAQAQLLEAVSLDSEWEAACGDDEDAKEASMVLMQQRPIHASLARREWPCPCVGSHDRAAAHRSAPLESLALCAGLGLRRLGCTVQRCPPASLAPVLQHQLSCGLWCTAIVYRACTSTMVVGTRSTGPLPVPVLLIRYRFATHSCIEYCKAYCYSIGARCAVVSGMLG